MKHSLGPDLSIVICTRNRAGSLATTLDCLRRNEFNGVNIEVIVADNGSTDDTRQTVASFRDHLPLRYLYEPTRGTYGKSHALNCAIAAAGLGEIVAIIDDDISPHKDWVKGVIRLCHRWPGKDLFTGKTYVIWPDGTVPGWALNPAIQSWMFSAIDYGDLDKPLAEGRWFSGNHFWFRSRVLSGGRRFKDIWLTEPDFMLQLVQEGYQGVSGPDAVAGHRVQPELLQQATARARAVEVGRSFARLRLDPYRSNVNQAVLFKKYPLLARLFCLANGLRWQGLFLAAKLCSSADLRFVRSLVALERLSTYRELLRTASQMDEYRVS